MKVSCVSVDHCWHIKQWRLNIIQAASPLQSRTTWCDCHGKLFRVRWANILYVAMLARVIWKLTWLGRGYLDACSGRLCLLTC